ncbi:MAG: anaerobic ribonucleoside-triphosphate reductase [Nitrososphaeria archaeon]
MESNTLNEILAALSSPIRFKMVRALQKMDLSYSDLMKDIGLTRERDAGSFSYHLKKLLRTGIVRVDQETKLYELSPRGTSLLSLVQEMESKILTTEIPVVRRSEYAMEPFDKTKIISALIREANVPPKVAHEVANVVKEKIRELKVEYLSAPLIREIINAVLIDSGYEKYRHKLTRVGLPLYDVSMIMKETARRKNPDFLVQSASSAVLREYSLLSALPRRVADAHVSGEIDLQDLDFWLLKRHSSIYTSAVVKTYNAESHNLEEARLSEFLDYLFVQVKRRSSTVIRDQVLSHFNVLLSLFAATPSKGVERAARRFLRLLLLTQIGENMPAISVGLSLAAPSLFIPEERSIDRSISSFSDSVQEIHDLVFSAAKDAHKEVLRGVPPGKLQLLLCPSAHGRLEAQAEMLVKFPLANVVSRNLCDRFLFSGEGLSLPLQEVALSPATYVDGVAHINMPRIAFESKGNEEKFFELLQENMKLISVAFAGKAKYLKRFHSQTMDKKKSNFVVASAGLFEAVKQLTHSSPLESHDGRSLMMRICRLTSEYLHKVSTSDLRIRLSSKSTWSAAERFAKADVSKYGFDSVSKIIYQRDRESAAYSCCIVPLEEALDLEQQLKLEREMHPHIDGGHYSLIYLGETSDELGEDRLLHYLQEAFSQPGIDMVGFIYPLTVCRNCGEISLGVQSKCDPCGSKDVSVYRRRGAYLHP